MSTGHPASPEASPPVDVAVDPYLTEVMDQIQAEVRKRRAAGDFPPSEERRLDRIFARFTPVGDTDGHFAEALKKADRSAYIDIEVPTASEKPGVSQLKRTLRRLMAWYLNYLVQQLVHFTSATMRVLHLMDERVTELELEVAGRRAPALEDPDEAVVASDLSEWDDFVVDYMGGTSGRVLHAECGEGGILARLQGAAVDAYGVDSRARLLDAPARAGLDVRLEEPFDHIGAVADAGLSGLILSGFPDRMPLGAQRRLVTLARTKLARGGRFVLVGTCPRAWSQMVGEVGADLAPGHPLHGATWAHLLEAAGFEQVRVESKGARPLAVVEGTDDMALALNANVARIDEMLFGPTSFAVVATLGG
ncbi:MAG: hypothetical protein ACRD0I_12310 [Acidimicrobiales bacterium]